VNLEFASGEVCDRAERIGTFKLALGADRTTFSGTITDVVVPAAVFEVLAEDGSCELLGPRSLFCDPECESGTTCDGGGSCIPTPANRVVGDVSVSGLLAPLEASPHPRRQCLLWAKAGAICCSLRPPSPQIAKPIRLCEAAALA
jgi:hypothetical protein